MQSKGFDHLVRLGLWRRLNLTQVGFTFLLFLGWGLLGVPQGRAQITTATMLGTVSDSSGSAIPGAVVTATNEATGRSYTATTGAVGSYLLPLLPITGTYALSVEAKGFQKFLQTGLTLRLNQNQRLDVVLQVGAVTQTVQVTAAPTQVDTESSSLGEVVDKRQVTELPLNGRNPVQLASLVAGVTTVSAPTVYSLRNGAMLSVNGSRMDENDFLLDGSHYEAAYFNSGLNYPSPDALQEFKLITNTFSAEYGRNAGSIFNAVVKSGSNQIHGDAWEFLRNDKLNSRNFFLNQPGAKVAKLDQNQFGFTAGGPAIKDKFFWFGSYQGLRIRQQSLRTSLPPTAAERAGLFTTPLKDPTTGAPIAPNAQGLYFIDPSRFDPVTTKIMNQFMPLPGADGTLTQLGGAPTNNNQFVTREDVNIRPNNILNISYMYDRTTRMDPFFTSQFLNYSALDANTRGAILTLTDTHTFTPTLLNQFRVAYQYVKDTFDPGSPQKSLRDWGSLSYVPDGAPENPTFNVSGRFGIGTVGLFNLFEDSISRQAGDTVTWIHGKHNIKTGVDIEKSAALIHAWYLNEGNYTFNGQITGNAVADFLVGRPAQYQRQTFAGDDINDWDGAGFFQDDWRVSQRLTVNLGLRYQIQTPYVVNCCPVKNAVAVFRPGQQSTVYPSAPRGLIFPGDRGVPRGIYPTDKNDWEPRIGFAWDPTGNGRTAVRVSYGIFNDLVVPDAIAQGLSDQPFTFREQFNSPPGGVVNTYQGFPNPWPYRAYLNPNPAFILPAFVSSTVPNIRNPMIQGWTVDIQRQLTPALMGEVSYVGKQGVGLELTTDGNPAIYIPGTDASGNPLSTLANINSRRVYAPNYAQIRDVRSVGRSIYNALQFTGILRPWHGLFYSAAYTWSQSRDDISTYSVGGAFPQDPLNIKGNFGPSDFDLTNVFRSSWVYDVPDPFKGQHGSALKQLTSSWEISGITTLQSGSRYSIMSGVANSLNGIFLDRADLVGNPQAISNSRPRGQRILDWFNTSAFTINPVGRVGNSERNLMRGPAYLNTDFALMKNFPISDRWGSLQFRSEFFNGFNQVHLGNPNNVANSAAFGRIFSAGDPRLIQFGLKYIF